MTNACKKAGRPGLLLHDMRRSAARNMRQEGVDQSVIMEIGGWKTDSMFRRYAIVSSDEKREALRKVAGKDGAAG